MSHRRDAYRSVAARAPGRAERGVSSRLEDAGSRLQRRALDGDARTPSRPRQRPVNGRACLDGFRVNLALRP